MSVTLGTFGKLFPKVLIGCSNIFYNVESNDDTFVTYSAAVSQTGLLWLIYQGATEKKKNLPKEVNVSKSTAKSLIFHILV